MKKIVILSRTAWDGALNAWQEFMEVEIDVPEPPRPDMECRVCGERVVPEEEVKQMIENAKSNESESLFGY